MSLTPTNRYGLVQGITLKVWPLLEPLLRAALRSYRGIPVATLGQALPKNVLAQGEGTEVLEWDAFRALTLAASD